MQISRLLFVETGTYNDMALRPYTSFADQRSLLAIQEATKGGQNLSAEAMAGVAGQLIRPSTEAQGVVSIAQGWDTPRLRFMMEVIDTPFSGGEVVQYLTGYTDDVGISYGGAINPNMRLYFNSSIKTNRVAHLTPLGRQSIQTVVDASHVLSGDYVPSLNNVNQALHTMRPEDVFKTIGTQAMLGDVIDTRSTYAGVNSIKKSRRSNGSATNYLSRVMQAHAKTAAIVDPDQDFGGIMQRAAGAVREGLVNQDTFLAQALRQTSLVEGSSLTYAELCAMSPGLDDRVVVSLARGVAAGVNHNRGSTEYWNGTTNETIFATILSHSVPGIMSDLMLQKVSFMATNQTLDGRFFVQFADVGSFAENVDLTPYVQMFQHRLLTEILNDLTQNGSLQVQIVAQFDLLGETSITISLNGGPQTPYCTPSFADGLMAPVVTNNAMSLKMMAHDVHGLIDNINTDYSPQATGYSSTGGTPSLSMQELFTNGHSSSV